jgi:glucose-6-phosphate isomerase
MSSMGNWKRYTKGLCLAPELGLTLDIGRMRTGPRYLGKMQARMDGAYDAMESLEKGGKANRDEDRMAGHYWLRAPDLAPTPEIAAEIRAAQAQVASFAADVHAGVIKPPAAGRFTQALCIGIGGSALGPMFVADALGDPATDRLQMRFVDNTDPEGIARTLASLSGRLGETLCIVTSKSGGTPETRNGAAMVARAYKDAGLHFPAHAVAITQLDEKSKLFNQANAEGWLALFPMWDWVGGRTSELSAVGLLPAALQGLDIAAMLAGAAACDAVTRSRDTRANPAALLALMWYSATKGRSARSMVVLPYKDRLQLFSRYLQQLVMESLGKAQDLNGAVVHQGIQVYGNKGSTDQHSYVQQLREGPDNFFVTFIRVLESGGGPDDMAVTAGDYLHGLLLGTRAALFEAGRQSLTITIRRVDAYSVGVSIALFERAVGFYASLVNINAYNQPGVEAGKKAAEEVLKLQGRIAGALSDTPQTARQIAAIAGDPADAETVHCLLEHLAANGRAKIACGDTPQTLAYTRR